VKILIAEDDPVSRRVLVANLKRFGHEPVETENGLQAWEILQTSDAPRLAVLDWMMPEMDGPELCRRLRAREGPYVYVLLLTAKHENEDRVAGLEAGADDYITKPFQPQELRSRISAGERILALESSLAARVAELEAALAHVQRLQGLLPICMHCKKIRNEEDVWEQMESYIEEHSDARFSHALCQECLVEHYPSVAKKKR
jgi:DNA-binding response OmpR family regulator